MTDSPMNENTATFTDSKDRVWDITMTLLEARRIKNSDYSNILPNLGEVDLVNPSDEAKNALGMNDNLILAIVWTIIQPQLASHDITSDDTGEEEYLSSINAVVLADIKKAFEDSIGVFCPTLKTVFATSKMVREKAEMMAPEALAKVMASMDEMMDVQLEKAKQELKDGMSKIPGSTSGQ